MPAGAGPPSSAKIASRFAAQPHFDAAMNHVVDGNVCVLGQARGFFQVGALGLDVQQLALVHLLGEGGPARQVISPLM